MDIQAGSHLGPYEIIAPVGAGGMGEVYRARDTRIGREVAIKILPQAVVEDRDRLARFQREAQSAGSLNHPNLLTIHEFASEGGEPYIVSELLEGSTLRERLGGAPLPQRKAIDYALQIANGLAAAHEKGIIHRDLKPENIFVTRDGRVKILDFGLAKTRTPPRDGATDAQTEARETDPGTVVGTAGYMSPEQVRAGPVDHRSDLFALGAILYEMLSGRRAFRGSSSIDTMHSILHDDPPELSGTAPQIPAALERVVQHCLEKNPEERFQSARDLAFDLENISGASGSGPRLKADAERASRRALIAAIAGAALITAAAAGWFAAWRLSRRPPPEFTRITFRNATLTNARFIPGQTAVVFDISTSTSSDILMTTLGQPEARPVGVPRSLVMAVSRSNELAVLINPRFIGGIILIGTLARVPLGGGAPRELAENVQFADWTPSGDDLLIARRLGDRSTLELPVGRVLYTSSGWISSPRMSRDGKTIAFIEHPVIGDDGGYAMLMGADRKPRQLSMRYYSAQGLVWSPRGDEIFFTASEKGNARALRAVSLSGRERLLVSAPNILTVLDSTPDGRLLVAQSNARLQLFARGPEDKSDRDLSWLDWSSARDISPDGKMVLFDETGEGGKYSVYIRPMDGAPATRLGEGGDGRFSPDGQWAIVRRHRPEPNQIYVYPIGMGEARQVTNDAITHQIAAFLPDGRRFVFIGYEPNQRNHFYVQNLAGGPPRMVSTLAVGRPSLVVSPDSTMVCVNDAKGMATLVPLSGGPPTPVPEIGKSRVIQWSADGKSLYFLGTEQGTVDISRLDLATRHIERVKQIAIPTAALRHTAATITPDARAYAYTIFTDASDLYLLDGVR